MDSNQHHQSITIPGCKVSSSEYVKRLFSLFMTYYWALFLLPVLVLASLSVVNVDFLIVALMAIFIMIPMVLTLLYFNYALTDEARLSISEKELKVTVDGLHLKTLNNKEQEYFFQWKEFYGCLIYEKSLLLQHDGKFRFFMIPCNAFHDNTQRNECIAFIKRCITLESK